MPLYCADKGLQIVKATDQRKVASTLKRQKVAKLLYLTKSKYFP